jgi:hypothetical protein
MNMKRFVSEFFRRGLTACGFGPIILAVLYLILHYKGAVETLSVIRYASAYFQ